MKCSEFIRWLKAQGCTFGEQTGSHVKVYCRGKQSVVANHKSKEMPKGTMFAILAQPGLKEKFQKGE